MELWAPSYAGLFALVYLVGCASFRRSDEHQLHPLVVIGFGSVVVLTIVLSFQEFWKFGTWNLRQRRERNASSPSNCHFLRRFAFRRSAVGATQTSFLDQPDGTRASACRCARVGDCAKSRLESRSGYASSDSTTYMRGDPATAFWLALLISLYALSFGVFTLVRGLRGCRFVGRMSDL